MEQQMADAGGTVDVGVNLRAVKAQIEAAEKAAGRAPGEVTLVAVGKVQPVEKVEAALAEGQRIFGENRRDVASDRPVADKQGGRCHRALRRDRDG